MTRMSLARRAAALGAVLAGAVAAPAAADTYCVADPAGCAGTPMPDLGDALAAAEANAGPDTVRVGAGTFSGPFYYASPDELTLVGSGSDATKLRTNSTLQWVLELWGGATASDLGVELAHDNSTGISLGGGAVAEHVSVQRVNDAGAELIGVRLNRATLARADIELPVDGDSTGVATDGYESVVRDSAITARRGIAGPFGPTPSTVRRVHVRAGHGILVEDGALAIDNVVVEHAGTSDGSGIVAGAAIGDADVTIRHATIVGHDKDAASYGVAAASNGAAAQLELRDSIITGWDRSVARAGIEGMAGATADVDVRWSHLAAPALYEPLPGAGAISTEALVAGAAAFAPGFRLPAGSPFVDAGEPAPLGAGESGTDLAGVPRIQAGTNGAPARRDLGAFELPTPAAPAQPGAPGAGGQAPVGGAAGDAALSLKLRAKRRTLRKRLKVHATTGADASLRGTARIKIRGRKGKLRLRRAIANATAGTRTALRLKAGRKTRRIVKRALRNDRRVTVKVRVKATAADGRTATAKRKVRLRS